MATDSIKTTKRRYDTTGMSDAPKHDVYTKERLYELKRCPKSFAMSVAHPELDNTHLTGQQEMYGNIDAKQSAFDYLTQIVKEQHPTLIWHDVKSESGTLMERAMRTARWLRRSIPSIVTSPAFCDDRYVIPADLVVVNDDGSYDVYHCSAKGFMNSTRDTEKKSVEIAFDDMAFMMLAVVRKTRAVTSSSTRMQSSMSSTSMATTPSCAERSARTTICSTRRMKSQRSVEPTSPTLQMRRWDRSATRATRARSARGAAPSDAATPSRTSCRTTT